MRAHRFFSPGLLFLVAQSLTHAQGLNWRLLSVTGPSPRVAMALAYDSDRAVIVLFGGNTNAGEDNETWEWNGATRSWVLRDPSQSPSPRYYHAMAYDSDRDVTVLFGGYDDGPLNHGDTWEWRANENTWVLRCTSCGPRPRRDHRMVYDSARKVVMMFGGYSDSGVMNDTWTWDGATGVWSIHASGTNKPPARRRAAAMAYDVDRQITVLYGGAHPNGYSNETWEWNGISWIERFPQSLPTGRGDQGMAFDSHRHVTVLFGGDNDHGSDTSTFGDTWEWNGSIWALRSTTQSPPPRFVHGMAYDANARTTVIFGGAFRQGGKFYGDTWGLLCDPDLDGDGLVTTLDFDLFVYAFESGDMFADFDGDGFITGIDFDLYVEAFEAGC